MAHMVHSTCMANHRLPLCRKQWLQTEGSPKSKIERAVFTDEKEISDYSFSSFEVRR